MIWFTSDHHFGHANIIKYCNRPFKDTSHMDEMLIAKWNEKVQPGDTVFYLGDFSLWKLGPKNILPRLNGEIHLVAGNHDWVFPIHCKTEAKKKNIYELYSGFKSISFQDEMLIGLERVVLSHLPYTGDHYDKPRFVEYRPKDEGKWLLHGHVHNAWLKRGKQINVGVDRHDFYPVSIDQIIKLMEFQGDID